MWNVEARQVSKGEKVRACGHADLEWAFQL